MRQHLINQLPESLQPIFSQSPIDLNGVDITNVGPYVLFHALKEDANFIGSILNDTVLTKQPVFKKIGDELILITDETIFFGCIPVRISDLFSKSDDELISLNPESPEAGAAWWHDYKDQIITEIDTYKA